MRTAAAVALAAALPVVVAAALDPAFRDVTAESGITFRHHNGAFGKKYLPETMGAGVAILDVEGDGDQDVVLVNGMDWPERRRGAHTAALYRNRGDGTFEDATRGSGLDFEAQGMGVAAADIDNDGDTDLFLTALGADRVLRNDGKGKFTGYRGITRDVTERRRVAPIPGTGAARAVLRAPAPEQRAATQERIANHLLAALPRKDYLGLLDGLEPVTLTCGTVLYEPDGRIEHVFFPIDCLVSLLSTVQDRRATEVGLVGREGMVGVSLALGVELSCIRAQVQGTGTAVRMKAARFQKALQQCLPLQRELYRYAHAKLAMARQSVACNRFHTVEARLARWLLMTGDRVPPGEFLLTQEFLGDMLGVLRAAVNVAAGSLQERKLIQYSRGKIRILDRRGLEGASCRCYTRIAGLP